MRAGSRLALYGLGLVAAFGAAYGLASVLVPGSFVAAWVNTAEEGGHVSDHSDPDQNGAAGQASDHDGHATGEAATAPQGVSLSAGGYALSPVEAPTEVGKAGTLSFRIENTDGEPLTDYTTTHERDMHLIVVRSDGSDFRHEHAQLDRKTGTWSLPWTWTEAGTFRVYADFAPGEGAESGDAEHAESNGADDEGADGGLGEHAGDASGAGSQLTLSRTVEVAGDFTPVDPEPKRVSQVDGYTATLDGDLTAGESSELTISIERDGEPVTALQPYLGAFGHLVALRQGDLAFLHVHPEGGDPETAGPESADTAGPEISFAAEAPTAGRYLLYLDFKVGGKVRTATFVVDAGRAAAGAGAGGESGSGQQPDQAEQSEEAGHSDHGATTDRTEESHDEHSH
ncbi:MAG: heavy-metal-associated domain-containing protein [Leucobacter sp.]